LALLSLLSQAFSVGDFVLSPDVGHYIPPIADPDDPITHPEAFIAAVGMAEGIICDFMRGRGNKPR